MRASLIFSSTSHSINVQKVRPSIFHSYIAACGLRDTASITNRQLTNYPPVDFQDCSLKSLRPQMHNSRNRKCWRTSSPLPIRRLNYCHT